MGISFEDLNRVSRFGVKKHIEIVDGYISSGLSLDDLTIHYGVDQESIAMILHGYGFYLGPAYGDPFDSKNKYKGLPFVLVQEFVSSAFPGFQKTDNGSICKGQADDGSVCEGSMDNGSVCKDCHLESFLDAAHPGWRMPQYKEKKSMFYLSPEELKMDPSKEESTHYPLKKSLFHKLIRRK
jgi:hypothetical protein